ncbi:unnamed protein product [Candidula unifasciata]|uniref:Uncharacterized protein n=1 Tax=Candidula unifasciata TaxID=100452 RepID=A0A8S4A378_9EUPU|nr:unnamed protein product [Candidula unifasciata]
MYIPVFQGELPLLPSRAHMRSISCQVTTIEETSEDEDRDGKTDKEIPGKAYATQKTSQSSGSDYTCRREDPKVVKIENDEQKLVKSEKESQKMVKDEKEEAKAELDDGVFKKPLTTKEKIKVAKEAKSVASSCSVVTSNSGSDTMSEGRGEKEYATFSAQFPPPEWVWYQQQMEKHKRTESWVSQQSSNIAVQLPSSSARPPVKKKSYQYKEHLRHVSRKPSMLQSQEHAAYMPMSAVSSLEGKFVDSEVKHDDDGFVRPWPVRSENIYESFSATSSIKRHHHKPGDNHGKCCQRTSEYGGAVSGDTTLLNSSNVYQSVRTLSPVARVSEAGSYAKLIEPQLGPLHSTPFSGKQKDRTANGADGHEVRDRIYGPPEAYHKRRSRRSQHRQQRLHSFYSGHGSDISYEYKGRLPKRNSSQAQSRDSGVNCVGLGTAARAEPMYENTLAKQQRYGGQQQQYSHEQQYKNYKHLADNQTQFEITNATENTDLNTESIIDSTTNSVVCQGRATNEAYNSVVYQDSLTNEAYNSVVYGSMGDVNGAPSVVCHTIASSCQDTSEMALPYNSLQSTFYDESKLASVAHPKASRHFPGSQGSPDTLIVDVVGTATESEGDDSDSSDDLLQYAGPNDIREVCTPVNCNPAAVRTMSRQQNLDEAVDNEAYDENGDEVDGGDKCACCKQITKGQDIEKPDSADHKNADDKTGSQPSAVPQLRERTDRLDSGFSSPRNPEKSADTVEHSDQSNSSKPQGSGANRQGGSNFPQLKHQLSHDSSNTHQSSNVGSSGHHSNSDACLATGSDHQSGSVSDNGNSSSGAHSGHRDCEQVPPDMSRMKHGCSLNSLKSDCLNGRAHRPASKHAHHYDAYDHLVRSKYKEHSQQRIPLHPNAMLVEHRPHHRSRPKQERSRSVDLLQSDSHNDLHKFGRKYHSKKYGLMDEFEVMGVL